MADSPAANQGEQPKKITFRFCRECANLLYPKEDKETQKLEFACRTCYYAEPAETTCIFRNELTTSVGDTAGITQDIGEDPTVGDHYHHDFDMEGDSEGDPNADFYTFHKSSFPPSPAIGAATGKMAVPDFCTMCGSEVFCEYCGQPSDRGCFLEVDEEQAEQMSSMLAPPNLKRSNTDDMMKSSQTQLSALNLQQEHKDGSEPAR